MTFRLVAVQGKRGRLTFPRSLADAVNEIEQRAEHPKPPDYVWLALDRDVEPILEVRNG
jgi:hypothetical protein